MGQSLGTQSCGQSSEGPGLELSLALGPAPLLRALSPTPPRSAPLRPACLAPRPRARAAPGAPQPLPPADAPLKSYLASCSPFPPCPGLICLLPPTHPPPASHLYPPPHSRRPMATVCSCPVLSAWLQLQPFPAPPGDTPELWVRTPPPACPGSQTCPWSSFLPLEMQATTP